MSYVVFEVKIAVKEPFPSALKTKIPEIKNCISQLKSFAVERDEEDKIIARYHICHHDEKIPCEPWQDI